MEQTADSLAPDKRESDEKAKKYNRTKRRLSILNYIVDFLFLLFFLITGLSLSLQTFWQGFTENSWVVVAGYFFVFIILFEVLSLPISFASGFIIEHRYNLSNQSLKEWLKDKLKGFLISIALGLLLLELLYWILRSYPSGWWLLAAVIFSFIFVLLTKLFPVIFIPLFFKLTPLEDEGLKRRLIDLCKRSGAKINDVYKIDFSKKSRAANAGLVGLGNTRKIILSDTLVNNFDSDEIEVIMAHELGHYFYRHMPRLIVMQSLLTFFAFFVADKVLKKSLSSFHFEALHDIGNLPILLIVFFILSLIFLPFANGYSRRLERAADRYALTFTKNREAFISSMRRLAALNLAEIAPSPLTEFIFYSHPSIGKRIEFAKEIVLEGGTY